MVTRCVAAQRQIDEAIRLWIDARDPFSIHTLSMAAFGILHDLHKKYCKDQHHQLEEIIARIGRSRLFDLANKLKHADRDPLTEIEIPTDKENEWRIGISLTIYRDIENTLTPEMGAFYLMSLSTYPHYFLIAADDDPDIEMAANYAAALRRDDVELRRLSVRTNLQLINDGVLPKNINLRRRR